MASRSASLALKAAVVAALVAMLVVPSSGRCRSAPPLPAPTPPPLPAPAPAPGPMMTPMSCNHCTSQCYKPCFDDITRKCIVPCESECKKCFANAIIYCASGCNGTCSCNGGTCTEEYCRTVDFRARCRGECSSRNCISCRNNAEGRCRDSCIEYCDATNCIEP